MTQLERTIAQLLSERQKNNQQEEIRKNIKEADDRKIQQYVQEFDSIYQQIKSLGQMEKELIKWVDQGQVDDARKEIVDGAGFYQHLLQKARSAYQTFREEGYEPQTAFDKGTADLTHWIEYSTQKASGGTIYLNHSPGFLHRLRHMED